MAGPEIKAPAYREYPTIPALKPDAMAALKSFPASEKI